MISSLAGSGTILSHFHRRGASKFTAADHQGFVEHAALFEIDQECSQSGVAFVGDFAMFFLDVGMAIPGLHFTMPCLNEAYAPFDQSSGHEQLSVLGAFAVELEDGFWFFGDIECVGSLGLHSKGQLKGLHTRFDGCLTGSLSAVMLIEVPQQLELVRLFLSR